MKPYKTHIILLLIISHQILLNATTSHNLKTKTVSLLKVFELNIDVENKDVLKLYDNGSYELLFFQTINKKHRVKKEVGNYTLKNNKLNLKTKSDHKIKTHPTQFIFKPNEGLFAIGKSKHTKYNNLPYYAISDDKKYWAMAYTDPVFGEVKNKKVTNTCSGQTQCSTVRKKTDNDISDAEIERIMLKKYENNTNASKQNFISKDSLKKLKAILVVGPVQQNTNAFIADQKLTANYLRSLGIQVVEFYHPNAIWDDIVKAAEGANIFIYNGHGNIVLFSLSNGHVYEDKIKKELKLNTNAILILNHACYSAGSTASDVGDIGVTEATKRVSDYAHPFIDLNIAAYYSNGYFGCNIPFFNKLFSREKLKDIYTSEVKSKGTIEYRAKYKFNPNYEIGISADNRNGFTYKNVKTNGKTRKEKTKSTKGYYIAYVGRPDFRVEDLFR